MVATRRKSTRRKKDMERKEWRASSMGARSNRMTLREMSGRMGLEQLWIIYRGQKDRNYIMNRDRAGFRLFDDAASISKFCFMPFNWSIPAFGA